MAKAAFSAAVSLVGETLSRPKAPQSPMTAEVQARKQLVRASAEPRRVVYGQVQVSGTLLYASNGTDTNYVHLVVALAGHRCHAIGDIWLGDELLGALDGSGNCTTGRFADHVRVKKHLGSTGQAMDADLAAECPEWGAKNRPLKGITYAYLRIKRSRDVFPMGLPTPRFLLSGKSDILDPRTGLTGYTPNAALCTLDYILWKHGFNSALDEVVQSTWIASANVSDEDVPIPGGGTQKRYIINGSFTLDLNPVDVLDEMRSAMAGCASYSMGVWEGHAGAASSPVMDLSENDLRGPYKVRPRPSRAQLYNAVKGTYISAADRWVETDFPAITNATYEAQDGGERIYKDVKLPFCIDPYAAQRIAKTDLERHRQGIVVDFPARLAGLKLQVWDVVRLNIAQQGWMNKQFRVVDKKISLFGGADLVLEEYSPAIYSWTSLEATLVDPAPDTTLPNAFDVDAPTGLILSSGADELMRMADGTFLSRVKAAWAPPADAAVREAQVQYKKSADANWQDAAPVKGAAGPTWINSVQEGVLYDVRVRYENGLGVRSAWTQAEHLVVEAAAAAAAAEAAQAAAAAEAAAAAAQAAAGTPAATIKEATVTVDSLGSAIVAFDAIEEVQITAYELRSGASFEAGTLLASTTGNSFSLPVLSLTGQTLWIKGVYAAGGYTAATFKIAFGVSALAQIQGLSWRVAEPDLVFVWGAVPGASQYVALFEDGGVSRIKVIASPEVSFAIPKWSNAVFRVFAIGSAGGLSPYADINITLTGVYNYNEIVNANLPITSGNYINLAFTAANQIKRVSLMGSNPAAPYVQNINDADLYAFGYNLQNLAAANIANVKASWFRDGFWREKNGFFESGVLDLGSVLSGKLLLNLTKTVTYTGNTAVSNYSHVNAEYMSDAYPQELTDNKAFLSARLLVASDSPNSGNWTEVQSGDWVTAVRYVKLVVEVALAGPLTDITVTAGYLTLDVPDIIESGIKAGVTNAGATVTLAKSYHAVSLVLLTAKGNVKAWPSTPNVSGGVATFTITTDSAGATDIGYFAKGY